ncbi:MAG: sensor domain-containing protein, partial [Chloroflexi bacterium]|nr:sensor domain-containing protein [Chloroflexota bacterium]
GIGAIERSLAREMLGITIAEPRPNRSTQGIWRSGLANLRDPLTWKSLLYVLLKFPVSIALFCIAVTLLATTLGLLLAPLGYSIATFVLQIHGIHLHNAAPAWLNPIDLDINGTFEPLMFAKSFIFTCIGVAFWFLTRSLLRGLGEISGILVRALLSPMEWERNMPNEPLMQHQYEDYRRDAQYYQSGYEQGERASRDDTQPRAHYPEQPEMPTQEMSLQQQS